MATAGESSSSPPKPTDDKPVIVRVKRKRSQSPLDAFWLEINERALKRPLLDFAKLSISDNSLRVEELKAKKVLVQHVETVTTSETSIDIVQSFVRPNSAEAVDGKSKNEERRLAFKKDNRHDQNLSKARQNQEVLAKNARFEQIWRSRKGKEGKMDDTALREMCQFYDVVRVDIEEKTNEMQKPEDMSKEDGRMLSQYLPLLREFIPGAAEDIESDMNDYMSQQDEYVYDYYTVKNDMDADDDDDAASMFPRVQVEDEEYYDGPDESEYDSEDSNAEDNPRNDYPEEISQDEDEDEEEEEEEEEEGESGDSDETEGDSVSGSSKFSEKESRFSVDDEMYYDYFDYCDNDEEGYGGGYDYDDDEDWG